jgi:16S rRNA (cytosine1402-N4)-methyltransferase
MHIPVLLKEVVNHLNIGTDFKMIDGTVGLGGYAKEILKISADAEILGTDLDQSALDKLGKELAESGLDQKIKLVHDNYVNLAHVAVQKSFGPVDAVLLDLGFSSMQLDDPLRGFAFQSRSALDMRYDQTQKLTAKDIVNSYPETKLAEIFKKYGEENFSGKIAHSIVLKRQVSPITDSDQILGLIKDSLPKPVRHKANDSARRIFQALRIEVNGELDNLAKVLPQALSVLKPGGRILVISFHSLEDRIVKRFFVEKAHGCICPPDFPSCVCGKADELRIITRKPITASEEEINTNPRSKPAKLRVAEKLK